MSLPVVLRAAQPYAQAEMARLAAPGLTADTLPDFSALPNVAFRDGLAHLRIDPRHQPRTVDVPVAFFLKVAEALGARLLLNSRRARAPEDMGRVYVRLDFRDNSHVYLNRIVMDAPIGCVVRERGTNFRSHLPEDLIVRDAPLHDGPSKHVNGRSDAVAAILMAYDRAVSDIRATISRDGLASLLLSLLAIADARSAERLRVRLLRPVLQRTEKSDAPEVRPCV